MTSSVALVLDRQFGSEVEALARQMPVWIVSSSDNDVAIDRVRDLFEDEGRITSLLPIAGESERDRLGRALFDIDEHHGPESSDRPYEQVVVYGSAPEFVAPHIMKELGLTAIADHPDKFCLRKIGTEE